MHIENADEPIHILGYQRRTETVPKHEKPYHTVRL